MHCIKFVSTDENYMQLIQWHIQDLSKGEAMSIMHKACTHNYFTHTSKNWVTPTN